jgi:hypothetical protein
MGGGAPQQGPLAMKSTTIWDMLEKVLGGDHQKPASGNQQNMHG